MTKQKTTTILDLDLEPEPLIHEGVKFGSVTLEHIPLCKCGKPASIYTIKRNYCQECYGHNTRLR